MRMEYNQVLTSTYNKTRSGYIVKKIFRKRWVHSEETNIQCNQGDTSSLQTKAKAPTPTLDDKY